MRVKRIITLAAAMVCITPAVRAVHVWSDPSGWWDGHFAYDINAPRYTGQELSMDLFGSYLSHENNFSDLFETDIDHGFWGGGVGINYFFTPVLGLGGDFNISAKPGDSNLPLFDHGVGSLILRLPLGNSGVAPYILGSGGRAIGGGPVPWQWIYGGGVGLEYRWNPVTGVFTDARFLWAEKGTVYNRLVIRAGLRLIF